MIQSKPLKKFNIREEFGFTKKIVPVTEELVPATTSNREILQQKMKDIEEAAIMNGEPVPKMKIVENTINNEKKIALQIIPESEGIISNVKPIVKEMGEASDTGISEGEEALLKKMKIDQEKADKLNQQLAQHIVKNEDQDLVTLLQVLKEQGKESDPYLVPIKGKKVLPDVPGTPAQTITKETEQLIPKEKYTAEDLWNLKKKLGEKVEETSSLDAKSKLINLKSKVQKELTDINETLKLTDKEYGILASEVDQFLGIDPKTGQSLKDAIEGQIFRKNHLTGKIEFAGDVVKKIADKIDNYIATDTSAGQILDESFEIFLDNLKKLGFDTTGIADQIGMLTKYAKLAEINTGKTLGGQQTVIPGLFSTTTRGLGIGGNILGLTTKAVSDFAESRTPQMIKDIISTTGKGLKSTREFDAPIAARLSAKSPSYTKDEQPETKTVDLSNELYSATYPELTQLSEQLKQTSDSANLGNALQDALNNNNEQKKNSILFSILQNPKTRQLLRK
jgi:hypothetical protein